MAPKVTVAKAQKLSLLCIAGAIGFFYFQVEYGFEKSKVDENAVMAETVSPNLVQTFSQHFGFNEQALRSHCSASNQSQAIHQWISTKWSEHSIENHLFTDPSSTDSSILYGIHRSPFSDGKTATVFAMTYDLEDYIHSCKRFASSSSTKGLSSIANFITMSYALSSAPWCSKDIIFILIERRNFNYQFQQNQLPQHRHSSYHLFESFVDTILPQHTSIIVGGLILEIPLYSKSSALSMNVAGPLGFQPNFDIVATTLIAFRRNRFEMVISPYWSSDSMWNPSKGTTSNDRKGGWNSPDELRKTMIRSMSYQVVGKSNGYHGSLIKHRIDATSVVSYDYYNGHFEFHQSNTKFEGKHKRSRLNGFDQAEVQQMFMIGHSIELFVHSMSNLIEVFHHSTFNYIVISEVQFITMAKYSIPIGLLGAAPILEAYAMYHVMYSKFLQHLVQSVVLLILCILFGGYSYWCIVMADWMMDVNLRDPNYTSSIGAVLGFMVIFGMILVSKLLKYSKCKAVNDVDGSDHYVSLMVLLSFYALISQIWLPIALNFSCGLYFVTVTVAMLFVVRKRASLVPIAMDGDWESASLLPGMSESDGKEGLKVDTDTANKENEENVNEEEEKGNDKAVPVEIEKETVMNAYGMKQRMIRILLLAMVPVVAVYGILVVMDMEITELIENLKYDLLREDIYHKHPGWIVLFCTVIPTYVGCWSLLLFSN